MATSDAHPTSLPNEVLHMIFSDPKLSSTDLSAIRLSCKALHPSATATFAQRYLQDPYVMHDLERWSRGTWNEEISVDEKWMTSLVSRQIHFQESGEHLRLLNEVFKALGIHGTSVGIRVRRHQRLGFEPIRLKRILAGHQSSGHEILYRYGGAEVVNLALKASTLSGCTISRVIADVEGFPQIEPCPITLPRIVEMDETEALVKLEELALRVNSGILMNKPIVFAYLACNVELPNHLKSFELSTTAQFALYRRADHHHLKTLARCLKTIKPGRLQTFSLGTLAVSYGDLISFLDAHRRTLQHLSLKKMRMIGSWEKLLRCIATCLLPESFTLHDAWVYTESATKAWYTGRLHLSGKDRVYLNRESFVAEQAREKNQQEE